MLKNSIVLSLIPAVFFLYFININLGNPANSIVSFSNELYANSGTGTNSLNLPNNGNYFKVYSNSSDFLSSEGKTCKVAFDGCNTIQIENGYLGASTLKYCSDIYATGATQEWTCLERTITLGKDVQAFYDSLRQTMDLKYQRQVDNFISVYKKYLENLPFEERSNFHNKLIIRVEDVIKNISDSLSLDIYMSSSKLTTGYRTLSLLRLELMRMDAKSLNYFLKY